MMRNGVSLSGNERNVCFLNLAAASDHSDQRRVSRFATISALAGIDFADDARGLATVDWDFDGDLDLWVSNRTGPKVRFLRNDLPHGQAHFLALKLQGASCNRDAIGARVEVRPKDGPPMVQSLRAGEGFLSQSSKMLHFGLGQTDAVERLSVRWPDGGVQEFANPVVDCFFSLRQGGDLRPLSPAVDADRLAARVAVEPAHPATVSATLPVPVPLLRIPYESRPHGKQYVTANGQRPLLLLLWTSQCAACISELQELTQRQGELESLDIDVLALNIDSPNDAAAEGVLKRIDFPFESGTAPTESLNKLYLLHSQLFMRPAQLPVPFSFLIDRENRLVDVYRGSVSLDTVTRDVQRLRSGLPVETDLLFAGRWITKPRFFDAGKIVSLALEQKWLDDAAEFVERARNAFPEADLPGIFHRLGSEYALVGKPELARTYYRKAIELDPQHAPAWNNLGALSASEGDLLTAESCYRKAVEFAPNYAAARDNLGTLLVKQGKLAEAIAHFTAAVNAKPEDVELRYKLASCLAEVRQLDEARDELETLLEQSPKHIRASIALARVLYLMGENKNSEELAMRLLVHRQLSETDKDSLIELVRLIQKRSR